MQAGDRDSDFLLGRIMALERILTLTAAFAVRTDPEPDAALSGFRSSLGRAVKQMEDRFPAIASEMNETGTRMIEQAQATLDELGAEHPPKSRHKP